MIAGACGTNKHVWAETRCPAFCLADCRL